MSQTANQPMFGCTACGRQYAWKDTLAGRKVRCKCGQVMIAPVLAPLAPHAQPGPRAPAALPPKEHEPDPDDLLYALADDAEQAARDRARRAAMAAAGEASGCADCGAALPAGAVVCVECGLNLKTGRRLEVNTKSLPPAPAATLRTASGSTPRGGVVPYAPGARGGDDRDRDHAHDALGGPPLRESYIPSALVMAGLVAQCLLAMHTSKGLISFADAMPIIGVRLGINLVLSFVGIAIVMNVMQVGFGAVGPAILKVAAICLLTPAISGWTGAFLGHDSDFVRVMVSSVVTLPLAAAGFKLLFDLDLDEAFYLAIVISLVNDWAMMFLQGMLLSGGGGLPVPTDTGGGLEVDGLDAE
jgi:hypothetical protein